ncbi:protein FAM151A [Myripristis murdjan]|uniref:protein FAM151A n=1 Tax=Myripristis murdjan TaxID=586833 RepID=UPI001175F531|nr:protein FAM151A-like [Myripristis murdjan]
MQSTLITPLSTALLFSDRKEFVETTFLCLVDETPTRERMEEGDNSQREENGTGGMEEMQNRVKQPAESDRRDSYSEKEKEQRVYLRCLTRKQLLVMSAAVGLTLLLIIIITVTAVVVSNKSGSPGPLPSFPTDGDMLDFLVETGEISAADGLLATWYHRANNKSEMNKALASDVMILEADVNMDRPQTPNQKPVPIMAHPPAVQSDNTLDQWLDAVLQSRKGIKLDFKSLASVGPSLELLSEKNRSRGIDRPVWLNADILTGPNVPDFIPPVNGTGFLHLIQEKFPDVTLSPGWKVLYSPISPATYTRSMVEEMYDMIRNVQQKVTFPVHAMLVRRSWQHFSWLLSQSSRFSLTLWQGSIHPNVSDLLFVRDNSHPARVYYDIYEPTLSAFKQAARQQGRLRRFYPGGDLMTYFYHTGSSDADFLSRGNHLESPGSDRDRDRDSLAIHWSTVTDRASLMAQLSAGGGGMLLVRVRSDSDQPAVPLVEGSGQTSDLLTLQDLLELVGSRTDASWGVYLRVQTQQLLEASLRLLDEAYSREQLYRPVWIGMEAPHSRYNTQEFVSAVERLFPYVTLVLTEDSWPPQIPTAVRGLSQRLALHLKAQSLPSQEEVPNMQMTGRYDLIVEEEKEERREEDRKSSAEALSGFKERVTQHMGRTDSRLYVISH